MSSFQGTGHRLNRSTTDDSTPALSPAQVRERRLAAMMKNNTNNTTTKRTKMSNNASPKISSSVPFKSASPSVIIPSTNDTTTSSTNAADIPTNPIKPNPQDLSFNQTSDHIHSTNSILNTNTPMDHAQISSIPTTSSTTPPSSTPSSIITEEVLSIHFIDSFHKLMWDSQSTNITQHAEDQDRWFRQGIHTPALIEQESRTTTTTTSSSDTTTHDFLSSSKVWGLTQHHGGPCGVLAAVQAEMIRILWLECCKEGEEETTNTTDENVKCPTKDAGATTTTTTTTTTASNETNEECKESNNDEKIPHQKHPSHEITMKQVQHALALAMGRIIARCAVMPNINSKQDSNNSSTTTTQSITAKLILPIMESDDDDSREHHMDTAVSQDDAMDMTQTQDDAMDMTQTQEDTMDMALSQETKEQDPPLPSLPDSTEEQSQVKDDEKYVLSWEDLNVPLNTSESSKLKCVTFVANPTTDILNTISSDTNTNNSDNQQSQQQRIQQDTIHQLSTKIANYLYDKNYTPQFYNQGGVLLFTMSCAASRTIDKISRDMDDIHSNFTSSFGHCSQELMNLLLTGQAVSNVFDNTMTLGNEGTSTADATATTNANDGIIVSDNDILSCHGITYQPDIGYLSQLESLRYCSVGTFYKSPTCPIWVVGSTSHFTILFSLDESCLEECQSDILLNKCRRAFKSVSGGDESGFIAINSLVDVIQSLDSDSSDVPASSNSKKRGTIHKIGVENAPALAAYLEVSGAGIILWDDFWKAASRLLTGASLETVLQGNFSGTSGGGGGGDSVMATVDNFMPNQAGSLSDSPPPLLITQYGEEAKDPFDATATSNVASIPAAATSSTIVESDEELAKRLAAEWGTDQNIWNGTSNSSSTATTTATATTTTTAGTSITGSGMMTRSTSAAAFKSDEELARELQEQLDNDASYIPNHNSNIMDIDMMSEGNSMAVHTGAGGNNDDFDDAADAEVAAINNTATQTQTQEGELKQPAREVKAPINMTNDTQLNFEKYDDSFLFHHYNGLRGGVLTSFRITRLSSEEAVGSSVALTSTTRDTLMVDSAISASSGGSGGKSDLEDVMRTKYPSCLFDWGGQNPPYID